jgi:hypothetical protein
MSSILDDLSELSDTAVETECEMSPTVPSLPTDTSPDNNEPSPVPTKPAKKRGRPRKQPAKTIGVYMRLYQ